jgi:hypothetical protein
VVDIAGQLLASGAARSQTVDPRAQAVRRKPDLSGGEEKSQFLDVRKLQQQYLDYLYSKTDEIEEQKEARRYYHGAHWTADQIKILRKRHQPPLTWNRIARKINAIVGLVERGRSDPKALPRHIKSEAGADIATQVIRYVLDENDWKGIDPWCLLQSCIDGIAGVQMVMVEGDQSNGKDSDPDIALPWVIGDEYFYDPTSYRLDFSDALYQGISKWIDVDEAIQMFPDKEEELKGLTSGDADLTSNPDREVKWVNAATRSIRLIEHWYKRRGKWCWAFYVANTLLDEGISPFFNEKNKTISSFKMFSVAVDHDGDRYGFVRNLKGPQDSLNQSKSKALHVANSRKLIMEKGAVDDVEKARIEWARPDGVVEKNPGLNITPDDRTQDFAAFTSMSQEAKDEIDQFANLNVAAISGQGINNLSGRAIELLRQPGMAELGPFVLAIRQWKLQIYRAIWATAQRHWKTERWLRMVENDAQKAAFVQLNGLTLDQFGRPATVNALGALDVDIILEEAPDSASLGQDAFDLVKGLAPGTVPFQVIMELWPGPREIKNKIMQMMAPKPPGPPQLMAAKLQMEGAAAKNALTAANARKSDAQAQKASVETGQVANETQQQAIAFQTQLWKEAMGLLNPQPPAQPNPQGAQPVAPPMPGM